MNPVPPVIDAGGRVSGPLRARRCVRHAAREAVARCPSCKGFYCRECVIDHAGQLICADCLAKQARKKEKPASRRLAMVGRSMVLLLGFVVVWMALYKMGDYLLKIPPDFHDATIWKKFPMGGE